MLKIIIPEQEVYDEKTELFFILPKQELQLEHSLVSLSKWEAKWCKPFLTKDNKTIEETIDYVRAMTMTQNVDPSIYSRINQELIDQITSYIEAPMTATTVAKSSSKPNREVITSEVIYYWMVAFNIPFECQKWHLNRLLMLITVCNEKSKDPKKMSRQELFQRNRNLNATRRKALGTSG